MAKHPPFDANCACPICVPEKYARPVASPKPELSNLPQVEYSNLPAPQPDPKGSEPTGHAPDCAWSRTRLCTCGAHSDPKDARIAEHVSGLDYAEREFEARRAAYRTENDRLQKRVEELQEIANRAPAEDAKRAMWERMHGEECKVSDQLRARVVELERQNRLYAMDQALKLAAEEECDRLQKRVAELEADLASWHKGGRYVKLEQERDAARAENDTIRAANRNLEDKLAGLEILRERFSASNRDWVAIMLRDTARIRSMEAQAARMREALQRSRYWFPNPHEVDSLLDTDAQRTRRRSDYDFVDETLASTTAGTLALGCVEALRYAYDHSNDPGVVREAWHALDAYDQGTSNPRSETAENEPTSGGETPGGAK